MTALLKKKNLRNIFIFRNRYNFLTDSNLKWIVISLVIAVGYILFIFYILWLLEFLLASAWILFFDGSIWTKQKKKRVQNISDIYL